MQTNTHKELKILGYTGAHRTGKSTLAKKMAEHMGVPALMTSASEIYRMIGRDPKVNYPIDERIAIQEAILYGIEQQYKTASKESRVFVADRTPIDLAGYLLADVNRGVFDGFDEPVRMAQLVNDYTKRCIESTNRWFSVVVLVQPGIVTVEEEGKARACPAYMEHLNALMSGLLSDTSMSARGYRIPRRITNLDDRVQSSVSALKAVTAQHADTRMAIEAGFLTLH